MFRSYETGHGSYVTFILNVGDLENKFAGPNYYALSAAHFYEIYVDNNGDAVEDLTFQFYYGAQFAGGLTSAPIAKNEFDCLPAALPDVPTHTGVALLIAGTNVTIPLKQFGAVDSSGAGLNFIENYYINLLRGPRENPTSVVALTHSTGDSVFTKPFDNAGTKTIANYGSYASNFIYTLDSFGAQCGNGKVFVGQRAESFVINIGPIFDLINFVPIPGFPGAITDDNANNALSQKSVTAFVLEVPITCVVEGGDASGVIGGWTALRQLVHANTTHVAGRQTARLGHALVNELVIGLRDKAKFNKSPPSEDVANGFGLYVKYSTMAEILSILFVDAVNSFFQIQLSSIAPETPRDDLVAVFLTGISGINQPPTVVPAEMLRLNTSVAVTAVASQSQFGVIGSDFAGYPNGRRPGDDVIDITLRVVMGVLCSTPFTLSCGTNNAANPPPVGTVALLDGAPIDATFFQSAFPYLNNPLAGSDFGAGGRNGN